MMPTAIAVTRNRVLGEFSVDSVRTNGSFITGGAADAGVAGGAMLTRYLQQMLFELTPLDPAVFIAMPVVLASAVLGAALLSARPALTVAPLAALRHE